MFLKFCCLHGHPKHLRLEAGSKSPGSSSYLFHLVLHRPPYLASGISNSYLLQSLETGYLCPDICSLCAYTSGYI